MSVVKPKPNYPSSQSRRKQITQWTNQNLKQIHVTDAKRGKTRASESGLVWGLLLIGRESGASFFNQSQSDVKQNQSKTRITFYSQLKTALYTWLIKRCWVQSINHERCDTMEFWVDSADKLATQFHMLIFKIFSFLRRFWSRFGYTVLYYLRGVWE